MAQSAHHLASDAANRPAAGGWTASDRTLVAPVARPLSVSILALAAAASGVSLVLWAGAWLGASDIVPGTGLAAVARIVGGGLVVAAGFELVFAYGAWTLRSWAWPLGVTLGIASLVLTMLSAGRASSSAHLLALIFEVGMLWYLLSPRVHCLFEPNRDRGDH
ncbi:MAG TPA: DUF2127 domain-containing protein [Candidatus Limnocylindrales bacterium]